MPKDEPSFELHEQLVRQQLLREREGQGADQSVMPLELPFWQDDERGMPNEIVRSNLFTVRRGKRSYFKKRDLVVLGDGRITYTGEELRTEDEEVLMQVIQLFRGQNDRNWVEFTPCSFIVQLGQKPNEKAYERLRERLSRMQATAVEIYSKRLGRGVSLSLVRKFAWQDENGAQLRKWKVWMEREIQVLFKDNYYTRVSAEQRRKVGIIARKLLAYYGSHREPYPVKVATLQSLCDSESSLNKFRQNLKVALSELVAVNFLKSYALIEGDKVAVTRALPDAA